MGLGCDFNHQTAIDFDPYLLLYLLLQVQLEVKVWFVQDQLRGSDTTEIRVKFIKKLEDAVPAGED